MKLLLVLCVLLSVAKSYKILGVFPIGSKSHFYIGHALCEGLAEDGHEVTVVSPFEVKNPHKNYKQVLLDTTYKLFQQNAGRNNFMDFNNLQFWEVILSWYDVGLAFTNTTFSTQNFQNFLKTDQQFDVVIVESCLQDALYGLSEHFKAPLIVTSSFGASPWTTDLVGSPDFASYVPFTLNHYSDHMTFWQRMYNSFSYWFDAVARPIYFTRTEQQMMTKFFPNTANWPTLEEIKRNVSLVLVNSHVTYGTARPYAPNMIEVGGMQISRKAIKPLPTKIQTFLDKAKNGAIYISLGSNVLLTKLPVHQKEAILNAFSAYPNVRIVVKSDENIQIPSHNDSDVLVEPWFSQQSVLSHPNVKVFITHGGLLSTTESVYFGKPMIGIPFVFDQHLNMEIAQQKGHGISIPIETLSVEKMKTTIHAIMEDPSYTEQIRLSSDRYRHLLPDPVETAKRWVLHIAKNKGAPHLKSVAVDLPFYALYNLDVWAFVLLIIISVVLFIRLIFKKIIACVFPGSTKRAKID